jgi:hypothetical protein
LSVAHWQPRDEEERKEVAAGVIEDERADSEAEQEERRTSVDGWPYAVFLLFFGGALLLGSRLPDSQSSSAAIIVFAALELSALTLYLAKTRPPGRWTLQALVLALSAGGLYWGWTLAPKPGWFMGVAFLWGAAFGALLALAYLRKLRLGLSDRQRSAPRS